MSGPRGTYIGDGVYAEVRDGMIRLSTVRLAREVTDQDVIYLEPSVYAALVRFAEQAWTGEP